VWCVCVCVRALVWKDLTEIGEDMKWILTLTNEAQTALVKDPVRTAQYTLFISVIKTDQFML